LPSYRRTPVASVFFRKLEIAFGRDALERPLSGGDPIEAYCTLFDDLWPINVQKRVELSELIAATSQRSTGPFFTVNATAFAPTERRNPKGDVQYGLIAEEVAKVYPELVIRDEAGRIEGVRYEELAPLLLNEMQRQQGRLADQARELRELRQQFAELNSVAQRAEAALHRLESTR
jgi:hypothetical protein